MHIIYHLCSNVLDLSKSIHIYERFHDKSNNSQFKKIKHPKENILEIENLDSVRSLC